MSDAEKKIILLVDDEPEILEIYGSKLASEGFDVVTAPDGKEGVRLAKKVQPHLVLMDMKMPVMDGVEAFSKLMEDEDTKGLKIAFLTAFGDSKFIDTDVRYAKELGAVDFIKKGLPLNELVNKVRGCLSS